MKNDESSKNSQIVSLPFSCRFILDSGKSFEKFVESY